MPGHGPLSNVSPCLFHGIDKLLLVELVRCSAGVGVDVGADEKDVFIRLWKLRGFARPFKCKLTDFLFEGGGGERPLSPKRGNLFSQKAPSDSSMIALIAGIR